MKRKRQEKCIPLELLNQISIKYPGCWDLIERIRNEQGKQTSEIFVDKPAVWKSWCYIPIGICRSIITDIFGNDNLMLASYDASLMATLAPWRQYKEIFQFDEELVKDLQGEAEYTVNMSVPSNIFLKLPYPAMFIQTEKEKGFFVSLENDPGRGDQELRFVFVDPSDKDTPYYPSYIAFNNKETIGDQVKKMMTFLNGQRSNDKLENELAKLLSTSFQLVLYLCTKQPDLRQTSKPVKRSAVIHDSYREIRQWDVGIRYGNAIRAYTKKITDSGETDENSTGHQGSHAPKRPHIRRGHFHHYWVGSKSKPDERKQELIWLEPTFVNAGDVDELPTTIHPVK